MVIEQINKVVKVSGETDLTLLLQKLDPKLRPETYVFARVDDNFDASPLNPLLRFREVEGQTLILSRNVAAAEGIGHEFPCRQVTLNIHSSLEAVGLMAAVAGALQDAGIPANVVAGFYHDHIFVPADRAEQAHECLLALSGQDS